MNDIAIRRNGVAHRGSFCYENVTDPDFMVGDQSDNRSRIKNIMDEQKPQFYLLGLLFIHEKLLFLAPAILASGSRVPLLFVFGPGRRSVRVVIVFPIPGLFGRADDVAS